MQRAAGAVEDQAVETSGGSDTETIAEPIVTSVMAEATFLHMPLGTRLDAHTPITDGQS